MALSSAQEAQYAHNNGIDREELRPNVQAEYDRLNGEGWPQPQQPQYGPSARQDDGPKGFAITGMVLGIVSLVIPYGGIITAILAIIFAAVSRHRNDAGRGMAIAGLVFGIVALALWMIVIIIVVSVASSSGS